jgi:hypothetical protein
LTKGSQWLFWGIALYHRSIGTSGQGCTSGLCILAQDNDLEDAVILDKIDKQLLILF